MSRVSPPSPSESGVRNRSQPVGQRPFAAILWSNPSVPISAAPVIAKLKPGARPIAHAPSAAKATSDGTTAASHTDPRTGALERDTNPHHAPPMKLRINAA